MLDRLVSKVVFSFSTPDTNPLGGKIMETMRQLKTTKEFEVPESLVVSCVESISALPPAAIEELLYACNDPTYRPKFADLLRQAGFLQGNEVRDVRVREIVLSTVQIQAGGPSLHSPFAETPLDAPLTAAELEDCLAVLSE